LNGVINEKLVLDQSASYVSGDGGVSGTLASVINCVIQGDLRSHLIKSVHYTNSSSVVMTGSADQVQSFLW